MLLFRPKLLYRKRLKNIFEDIFKTPLFLVIANIGYGKTCSVKQFLNSKNNITKLWFSCSNETDNLYKIIKNINNDFLENEIPKTELEINEFINNLKINIQNTTVLVIDDFNDNECLNNLIDILIYKNIPNLHIVIICRTFPSFQYKKFLQLGLCRLLNQNDLAFTLEEQNEFFELNDIDLSESEQIFLFNYTNGWIAGTYLSLLSYRKEHNFDNLEIANQFIKKDYFD